MSFKTTIQTRTAEFRHMASRGLSTSGRHSVAGAIPDLRPSLDSDRTTLITGSTGVLADDAKFASLNRKLLSFRVFMFLVLSSYSIFLSFKIFFSFLLSFKMEFKYPPLSIFKVL